MLQGEIDNKIHYYLHRDPDGALSLKFGSNEIFKLVFTINVVFVVAIQWEHQTSILRSALTVFA